MWGFLTELGVCIVLIGFFVVSCQNVVHIVRGAGKFVLRRLHTELDRELGEGGDEDDEETLTTKVVRRRVIVKGNEVPDIPGEQVTEEEFTDEQGNIVTKKTVRKVLRRVGPPGSTDLGDNEDLLIEGTLQEPEELETDTPNYLKYAVLHREAEDERDSIRSEIGDGRKGAQIVKRAGTKRVHQ
ncbi:ankyrin-1 isoform X4 [Bombina bombina]|uniref:ankyrin-1 isoform X4 n=1 Tax=Bombina bombina TaxID=8345 RepID=UPI00235ACE14|nr:ankyrin-1 isoform X4 [Bombina bombina]